MWIENIEASSLGVDETKHGENGHTFELRGIDPRVRWMNPFETRAEAVVYHTGSIPSPKTGLWSHVRVLKTQPHNGDNGGSEMRSVCEVPREFIYATTVLPPNR